MIKTILVPARGDDADRASFAAALRIARNFRAHIGMLHVRMDPVEAAVAMTSDAAGGTVVRGLIDQLGRDAGEREAKARRNFDDFCARKRVALLDAPAAEKRGASAQWHVETGDEARWIAAYGTAADLIVASRGAQDRLVLETALLDTGRPLFIPSAGTPSPTKYRAIAIGWKPTPQAARAVAAAMPFLGRAQEIIVLTVNEADGRDDVDRLVRNLVWHGLPARTQRLDSGGHDPVETLLGAAKQSAQLLVMGGYGHSRLREWVFGGFTQRVLVEAPLPVLVAH